MKGVHHGIRTSDHVLLWAGSILDWLDPQVLIRAVARLAKRRDDIKLFFMGTRHPNPDVPPMKAVEDAVALARELGVVNNSVFFNDWVAYSDRWRYLSEADLGLSTHGDHLETRLSFRTRILDYIWAGLPIVCTTGDTFAGLVSERGLGRVVPPGDADALALAIEQLLGDRDERARCRQQLLALADEFRWSRVVQPLNDFCGAPHLAADRTPQGRRMQRQVAKRVIAMRWAKNLASQLGLSRRRRPAGDDRSSRTR